MTHVLHYNRLKFPKDFSFIFSVHQHARCDVRWKSSIGSISKYLDFRPIDTVLSPLLYSLTSRPDRLVWQGKTSPKQPPSWRSWQKCKSHCDDLWLIPFNMCTNTLLTNTEKQKKSKVFHVSSPWREKNKQPLAVKRQKFKVLSVKAIPTLKRSKLIE